jgi:hypothetical protein
LPDGKKETLETSDVRFALLATSNLALMLLVVVVVVLLVPAASSSSVLYCVPPVSLLGFCQLF